MSKTVLVIKWTILIFICVSSSALCQYDMVEVDNSIFGDPARPPSVFKHDEHNEKAGLDECNICHHVYEDGKKLEYDSSEDMYCSDCHAVESGDENPSLRKAFHMNCKGCHLERKAGPVMCGECHRK